MRHRPTGLIPVLLALWLAVCASTWADHPLEIIELRSRPAEDLIPLLSPIASADGTVTGTGGTLLIRAAPERVADIRRILQQIDRPARNLLIQVRQDQEGTRSGTGIAASVAHELGEGIGVRVGPRLRGGGAAVAARIDNTSRQREVAREVRVLEGRRAYISVGSDQPLYYRETDAGPGGIRHRSGVVYRPADSGFYVLPRLTADAVTLEVGAFDDEPRRAGGMTATGDLQTTVTGRLGEWIPLGAASMDATREDRGLLYYRDGEQRDQRGVYLRVLEVD